MVARIALIAALLTGVLALAESQAASDTHAERPAAAPTASQEPAEPGACPKVKVVYAGHGEADRAPCPGR